MPTSLWVGFWAACTLVVMVVLVWMARRQPEGFQIAGVPSPAVCGSTTCGVLQADLDLVLNADTAKLESVKGSISTADSLSTGVSYFDYMKQIITVLRTAQSSCVCIERGIPLQIATKLASSNAFVRVDDWDKTLDFLEWQCSFFAFMMACAVKSDVSSSVRDSLVTYIRGPLLDYNIRLFAMISRIFPLDAESYNPASTYNTVFVKDDNKFLPNILRKMIVDFLMKNDAGMSWNIRLLREFLFEHRGSRHKPGKIFVDGFIMTEFRRNKTADYNKYFMSLFRPVILFCKIYMEPADFRREFMTPFTNSFGQRCDLRKDVMDVMANLKDPSIILPTGLNVDCSQTNITTCTDPAVLQHLRGNIYFTYFETLQNQCIPNNGTQKSDGMDGSFGPLLGVYGHDLKAITDIENVMKFVFDDDTTADIGAWVGALNMKANIWVDTLRAWKELNKSQAAPTQDQLIARFDGFPYIRSYYLGPSSCPSADIKNLRKICFNPTCESVLVSFFTSLNSQISSTNMAMANVNELMAFYIASRRTMNARQRNLSIGTSTTAETIIRTLLERYILTPRSRLPYIQYLLGRLLFAFMTNQPSSLREFRDTLFTFLLEDIDEDGYIRSESQLTVSELNGAALQTIVNSFEYLGTVVTCLALLKYSDEDFVVPARVKTVFEKALSLTILCPSAAETRFNCSGSAIQDNKDEIMNLFFQRRLYLRGILRYSGTAAAGMDCNIMLNKLMGVYFENNVVKLLYDYVFNMGRLSLYRSWEGIDLRVYMFPYRDELRDAVTYWIENGLYTPERPTPPTAPTPAPGPSKAPTPVTSGPKAPTPVAAPSCTQYCDYGPGNTNIYPAYTCMLKPTVPIAKTHVGVLPAVPDWLLALSNKTSLTGSETSMVRMWLNGADICSSVEDFMLALRRQLVRPSPAPAPRPSPTASPTSSSAHKATPFCPPMKKRAFM